MARRFRWTITNVQLDILKFEIFLRQTGVILFGDLGIMMPGFEGKSFATPDDEMKSQRGPGASYMCPLFDNTVPKPRCISA